MTHLTSDYTYKHLSAEEFAPLFEKYHLTVFPHLSGVSPERLYSEAERSALTALQANLSNRYVLRLGIFHGEDFVGWHVGEQVEAGRFYMRNTGILEEHRGRGLYTALLPVILDTVKREGFQVVYSRHQATNNAVIVPKLKAGFVVSGFEVDDRYGTLVQLSYLFNPLRRKLMDVRVGHSTPDDEVKKLLF